MIKTEWAKRDPRTIELSTAEWEIFKDIGGIDWLRRNLANLHRMGHAKRERNRRIIKDHKAGMRECDICVKYEISRATAWRVVQS